MSNKKEYAIGDTVQMGLMTLVCIEEELEYSCIGCYAFHKYEICDLVGECRGEYRADNKDVIFKLKTE